MDTLWTAIWEAVLWDWGLQTRLTCKNGELAFLLVLHLSYSAVAGSNFSKLYM